MRLHGRRGPVWTVDRILAEFGHRRYNLPVTFDDAWPPDRAGELFLRQRLLPRSVDPWPHELWEAFAAALMRELARASKLAHWVAEFDDQVRRLITESSTPEDFRHGLRGLRVSVRAHRRKGPMLPPDMVRMLFSQWKAFFDAAWQDATGRYHERTLERFRESITEKRVFVRFTFGARVSLSPRAALEEIARKGIHRRTKPVLLARRLVGRFFGGRTGVVTNRSIARYTTPPR